MHFRSHAFMKFAAAGCTFLFLFGFTAHRLPDSTPQLNTRNIATEQPHRLIIKVRAAEMRTPSGARFGIASIDAALSQFGVESISSLFQRKQMAKQLLDHERELARVFVIRYRSDAVPAELIRALKPCREVEYAEPYLIYPFHHTPNDPMISQQFMIASLNLTQAWDVTTGDTTVTIGDVDSGVDWTHPDLAANIFINKGEWGANGALRNNGIDDDGNGMIDDYHGWDFIGATEASPAPDNDPMDGAIGHGTMTSGCASAVTNNATGIASPGYRCKILPVKTAGNNSGGISAGYEGIIYAADMGCKVINCSWGSTTPFNQAFQDVINYAFAKGALVVGSSGNNPLDNDYIPHHPSSLQHVLNVGSVESNGAASTWCTYGTSVHVYAPGYNVLVTTKGGSYSQQIGTSFSSPYVAGVAALLFSIHPNWNPDQVAKQIRVTAAPFSNPPQAKRFGRVDAFAAVSKNKTLTEIPGIQMKNYTVTTPSGSIFRQGGQKATINMTIENVLAPTSANCMATVEFDNTDLSCATPSIPIGAMNTFGQKTVTLEVTLKDKPSTSEGTLPVRLRIEDGSYVDFVMARVQIELDNAWRTALNFGAPSITAISAVSEQTVWAVANVPALGADLALISTNGGSTWLNATGSTFGNGAGVFSVGGIDANKALAGTGPTGGAAEILRTSNKGSAWIHTSVSSITGFVNFIHMFDGTNGIFQGDPLNGKWGIAKTTDGGVTWNPIATPLTAPAGEAGWNTSFDFIGDVGYFGTNNAKIYRTTNRGETWTALTTPDRNSTTISFRNELVGAVRFSTQASVGSNVVYTTTNGGVNWKRLSSVAVSGQGRIVLEKGGIRFWVVQDNNVFVSTDFGTSWTIEAIPSGFASIACTESYAGSQFVDIYAGGSMIYKYRSPKMTQVSVKRDNGALGFSLGQNFPNPVEGRSMNAITSIPFTLDKTERVSLTIFDLTGRRAITVFDAMLAAGNHTARFDAAKLPKGFYSYVLTVGGRRLSKMMIVQ